MEGAYSLCPENNRIAQTTPIELTVAETFQQD
jgi:hypothetical protein